MPVLAIVNVWLTAVPTGVAPKSVASAALGVTSPLVMLMPLPRTSISVTSGWTRQVMAKP